MAKVTIDPQKIFAEFRKIFKVNSYSKVAELVDFDSGQVSRMRHGKSPISPSFFLKACIACDISPNEMCEKVGLPIQYFYDI